MKAVSNQPTNQQRQLLAYLHSGKTPSTKQSITRQYDVYTSIQQ